MRCVMCTTLCNVDVIMVSLKSNNRIHLELMINVQNSSKDGITL